MEAEAWINRIESLEKRVSILEAKKRSVMSRPTVEEIALYCSERNNGIDAQDFFDHHERVGWVVGKNKTPMKNWQATIRTWEKTRKQAQKEAELPPNERDAGLLINAINKHDSPPLLSPAIQRGYERVSKELGEWKYLHEKIKTDKEMVQKIWKSFMCVV